jgi:pyruvate dehydrogenase E1 component
VLLCKTVKGWTLGPGFEGRNATHQIKKMTKTQLLELRDRLHLHEEIPESALESGEPPYFRPSEDSVEYQYMMERRRSLGGVMPHRRTVAKRPMGLPDPDTFAEMNEGSGEMAVSTTMGFTRLLRSLCRDETIGRRVVPIIPDEARTFGMDALFRELEIYASQGQKYEPVDHDLLLSYSEDSDGQILEEGITEAGSMASFIAAGTSYATRGVPMLPFYTFYSMFGFQRVGDLIWQATDARARGFLMGATAGRTTLLGEGLQHQDGHSLVLASTMPAVQAYDPAFAYEIGAIVRDGIERMYGSQTPDADRDIIYYLTLYNENYPMPALPTDPDVAREFSEGAVRGLYRFAEAPTGTTHRATILFSGVAHQAAAAAASELAEHYDVGAELWSATSYKRLRDDALGVERRNRLHPSRTPDKPIATALLETSSGPITAVSDFMCAVPEQIARFIPAGRPFNVLGTDGMGRSDTREALRRYFEVDCGHIVVATLTGLFEQGAISADVVEDAIRRYEIDPEALDPSIP